MDIKLQDENADPNVQPDMPPAEEVVVPAPGTDAPAPAAEPMPAPAEEDGNEAPAEGGEPAV